MSSEFPGVLAQFVRVADVTTDKLRLRERPSTSATIFCELPVDIELRIYEVVEREGIKWARLNQAGTRWMALAVGQNNLAVEVGHGAL